MPPSVRGAQRREPTHLLDEPAQERPARPAPSSTRAPQPSAATEARREAAVADFARNAPRPSNDDILYIGLNKESRDGESRALSRTGARVTTVRGTIGSEVRFRGRSYDLAERAGVDAFAADLARTHGLPAVQQHQIAALLARAPALARDELAQIAMAWAPGEGGGPVPSRFVLSGHSVGYGVVFGGGVVIPLDDLKALARVMPRAASQVEDVHFASCMTVGELAHLDEWCSVFPNLQTVWAYAGLSPLAPEDHLSRWAVATRGRAGALSSKQVGANQAAVAWSRDRGTVLPGITRESLRRDYDYASLRLDAFLSGEIPVRSPYSNDAVNAYEALRLMALHPQTPRGEREVAMRKADQMLRVRFYEKSVRGEIARRYGASLTAGYRALGLAVPDFSTMDRRSALRALTSFQEKLAATKPPPPEARAVAKLVEGLRTLDRGVVPDEFIH